DFQRMCYYYLQGLEMKKTKFSLTTYKDEATVALVNKTDQKTLAVWAIDCVERVMPYFEETYPQDHLPRQALETLKTWIESGVFHIEIIHWALYESYVDEH